ncbi:MAG: hypothetical protein IPP73_01040 [Chitinophagaceae bacterium]|nr:hypothetical protein [Chitinophagaceae bacterium]
MKSIYSCRNWLIGLTGITLLVFFSSYGNKQVHPGLNSKMVLKFLDRNNKGDYSMPEFRKYKFYFDKIELQGQGITKDGLFSDQDETAASRGFGFFLSSEGKKTMTVSQWIAHGGMAADVPEVPASLRHFYDPTRPVGERYLTDITNAKILGTLQKYVLSNPHTDGVQWALGKPGDISEGAQDHKFTWEHGKIWMEMALREPDARKKDGYMALAWRALGETLHMIADNGCPPHVRNDAHPSRL